MYLNVLLSSSSSLQFQQTNIQNPDFDLFSADAILNKLFIANLNRDLAMKKLKAECPEFYNLFLDKYNNSSNAFFFSLVHKALKSLFNQKVVAQEQQR